MLSHHLSGLSYGSFGERNMHCHLVAIKIGIEAVQTKGWSWIALPSISTGSKAWMLNRCKVGARFSNTGWSLSLPQVCH